jgi:endonuclease/exonuclease/phosphatase (EEP) superfamily protein YafD
MSVLLVALALFVAGIDHVLGRGVVFRDARVVKDGGSDHLAVVTSFAHVR